MDNLLIAENITKKFGDFTALNDVSLEIPRGSIFGLLGPNGAGKTSFIRIINQITLPYPRANHPRRASIATFRYSKYWVLA